MHLPRRSAAVIVLPTALVTLCACTLAGQTPAAPIRGFEELIRTGMRDDTIPGAAVVVLDSGRIRWSRGFGVADLATGRAVDPDSTLFRFGSVTKVLTAAGLLALMDREGIASTTPVREIARVAPLSSRPGPPVRIAHLLMHTGGFDQTGLGRHAQSPDDRPSLAAFLTEHLVPIRPPGAVATYDTYGISLAGYVLEAVSGTAFPEYMRRTVFAPLGMAQTFIEAPPDARARLAVGYGLRDGELVPQPYEWYVTLPASSADGTALDLARFVGALLGDGSNEHGRLLSPSSATDLREGAFRGTPPPFWDAWWTGRFRGHPVLYHGGVMRGYSSQVVLLPDRGAALVVLYNRDPETGRPPRLRDRLTSAFLEHMVPDADDEPPRAPVAIATDGFAGWWVGTLGCFSCPDGEGWPVRPEELVAEGPGAVSFLGTRWIAQDSLTFGRPGSGTKLRFARDDAGVVRYANAGTNGYERLDGTLVNRVSAWAGEGRSPGALRTLLAAADAAADRARAMAVLAARTPAVDPAGTFLFRPEGAEAGEPMRLELERTDDGWEGWVQPRPDRPRRPVRRVIIGGNDLWVVVAVPGGEMDLRLTIEGDRVAGVLQEGLERIPVVGHRAPPDP